MSASKEEIKSLFDEWNRALASGSPSHVADLYAEGAVLLPTLSNRVRADRSGIEDYFTHFLRQGPQGTIVESHVRVFGELAVHSGIYEFAFNDGRQVPARFTFVYRRTGDAWQIVEHHSSQMPE